MPCSRKTDQTGMPYFKTLSTSRLTLRPPRRGDADDLFALHSDAAVMRYFSEPLPRVNLA
jgi:RimJ/RimL family protein N-acetyltransferase